MGASCIRRQIRDPEVFCRRLAAWSYSFSPGKGLGPFTDLVGLELCDAV